MSFHLRQISRKEAERDAFRAVPETCPHVDDAMAEATRLIKQQTGALRDALVDAIQRANEAEELAKTLQAHIDELEAELSEARAAT